MFELEQRYLHGKARCARVAADLIDAGVPFYCLPLYAEGWVRFQVSEQDLEFLESLSQRFVKDYLL